MLNLSQLLIIKSYEMAKECFEDLDPFTCPICLDALQDPVTIPCGHNYCMRCIEHYWEKNGSKDDGYICPQCRKTFSPRPVLNINTMFAEVVERFKNTGLRDSSPTRYDTPGHTERENSTSQIPKTTKMFPEINNTHVRYCNNDCSKEKHTVIVVAGEAKGKICTRVCCPSCLDKHKAFSEAPEKTKTLESRTTVVKREHRNKDKTNAHDRKQSKKRVQTTGHRHRHRSGHTRCAKKGHETHPRKSSGHRRNSHGHHAGHRKRRLGIMVMTGTDSRRTTLDHNRLKVGF